MTETGEFDFTTAERYDEDLVRCNLNRVKRPNTANVLQPTLVKVKEVIEPTNFIEVNRNGMTGISRLNLRRAREMSEETKQLKNL